MQHTRCALICRIVGKNCNYPDKKYYVVKIQHNVVKIQQSIINIIHFFQFTMKSKLESVLATISAPDSEADLITAKIAEIVTDNGAMRIVLKFPYPAKSLFAEITATISARLQDSGLSADIQCQNIIEPRIVQGGVRRLPNIKNLIAVASGKGGVGKSATAVNVALALSAEGARVGMLDADIYGPSLPTMLGICQRPQAGPQGGIVPLVAHGLQIMSIGFLTGEDQPAIWRGPMATRALTQLLQETQWHDLDYLLLDMPPGTGDIQLTAAQKMPITGAIIVTTPQDIALSDAQKGLAMFNKVGISVLGAVENMSFHHCPHCGHESRLFGGGGGKKMCKKYNIPLLGELPLHAAICDDTDSGMPTVIKIPNSDIAARYLQIARRAAAQLAQKPRDHSAAFPQIVLEK